MNNKTGRKPESLLPVLRIPNQPKIQPMWVLLPRPADGAS